MVVLGFTGGKCFYHENTYQRVMGRRVGSYGVCQPKVKIRCPVNETASSFISNRLHPSIYKQKGRPRIGLNPRAAFLTLVNFLKGSWCIHSECNLHHHAALPLSIKSKGGYPGRSLLWRTG